MAEKKKPTKKKSDKAEVVVAERMGKPVGKELFEVDPKKADWTLERVDTLRVQYEDLQIELAERIYEVAQGEYYRRLTNPKTNEPYQRFEDYCEGHLGWSLRKGRFFVSIQKNLVLAGAGKDTLRDIGWWKAGIISALPQPERKDKKLASWLERAGRLSADELQAEVNKAKNSHLGEKRHSEEITKKETFGFYPEQAKNVETALEIAKKVSGSDVKSHNLDMICAQFVASRASEAGVKLKEQLDNLERAFKCKIVAFSEDGEKVIYGAKVAKQYGIS